MTTTLARAALAASAAASLMACTADIHDNNLDVDGVFNIDQASIELDSDDDLDAIEAGTSVHISIDASNVFLVDPGATPPEKQAQDSGHFVFYLDDFSGPELLITADTSVNVMIPANTPEGPHKVKCRVHRHDGTPTSATFEISITVHASITIGGQADAGSAGADAS